MNARLRTGAVLLAGVLAGYGIAYAIPAVSRLLPAATPAAPVYRSYDPVAMAKNSFIIDGPATLPGTILLVLRGIEDPRYPSRIVEVNRDGTVLWEYKVPEGFVPLADARKLPDGHVVFVQAEVGGERDLAKLLAPSVKRWIVEVDHAGSIVRQIEAPVSASVERLEGGNYLVADAARSSATELTPEGEVVWSWEADKQVLPYTPDTYVGMTAEHTSPSVYAQTRERGASWVDLTQAQRLANGNTLLTLSNLDLILEVTPKNAIVNSYGPLVLKHPHCATVLLNGHLLITDSGNARVIEVDRATHTIVWEYKTELLFPEQGCAQRLPNGDTLVTDSSHLRVLEVNPAKAIIWQLTVNTPGTAPLFHAYWNP